MALISELVTHLKLVDTDFQNGIRRSQNSLQTFAKNGQSSFSALKSAIAGLGIYALIRGLDQTTDSVSKLADESQRLNVSVESLQRLQFAAEQVGVSADSVNLAISRMLVNLGRATTEGGEAAIPFTQLGLSLDYLNSLNPDEQFAAIAASLATIQDPAIQAAAGTEVFSRAFMNIGAFIKSDIPKNIAIFKSLGAELSGNQVNAVDAYGDKVSELSTQWKGFRGQLLASLSGELTNFLVWIQQSIKDMGGINAVVNKAKFTLQSFGVIASSVADVVTKSFKGWKLAIDSIALGYAKIQLLAVKQKQQLASDFGDSKASDNFKNQYNAQIVYVEALRKEIVKTNNVKKELSKPSSVSTSGITKGVSTSNPLITELSIQKQITTEYKNQLEQIKQAIKAQQDKINKVSEERELLRQYAEGTGGENDRLEQNQELFKKLADDFKKMNLQTSSFEVNGQTLQAGNKFGSIVPMIENEIKKFGLRQETIKPEELQLNRLKEILQGLQILNDPSQRFGAGGLERDSKVELRVLVEAQEGFEAKIIQSKANKRVILETVNQEFNNTAGGIQ